MKHSKEMETKRRKLHGLMMKQGAAMVSPEKAREMLYNPPGGRPLSKKQRGLFGMVAGGGRPTRMK